MPRPTEGCSATDYVYDYDYDEYRIGKGEHILARLF